MFENYLSSKAYFMMPKVKTDLFLGNLFILKTVTILIPSETSYFNPSLAMVGCETQGEDHHHVLPWGPVWPEICPGQPSGSRELRTYWHKRPLLKNIVWTRLVETLTLGIVLMIVFCVSGGSHAVSALRKVLGLLVTLLGSQEGMSEKRQVKRK